MSSNNNKQFENAFAYNVIYAFEIKDDAHTGLIKIGETSLQTNTDINHLPEDCKELNQAALSRIKEYTTTAGIKVNLLYTVLAVKQVKDKEGRLQLEAFRDHDVVHKVLKNSEIKNKKFDGNGGREWFEVDIDTVKKAVQAVKDNYENLSHTTVKSHTPVVFRPEQEEAINRTIQQFENSNSMLWNAKMRFGKTLSALEVIKQCKFKKSIILTHRPVVNKSWYDDFKKIFPDTDNYVFGSKRHGNTITKLLKQEKSFVYFASLQDLRGSEAVGGRFDKNIEIFDTVWDCVIVDEAHEGTQTALGDETIKAIVKEKEQKTKFLALSGTPFNILDEYNKDSIYTWDYVMEQECKSEWDKLHFGDSNPYAELPELRIYTYNLGEVLHNSNYITYEDKAFNFHEFFRTWTGDFKNDYAQMPEHAKIGDFVHEQDILSFLNLMTRKDEKNNYPYSNEEYRDLFKHSLWMVPGVKEAKALQKLMSTHEIFGNGQFEIINVAGNDNEEALNALDSVNNAIKKAEQPESPYSYTITISCGRLTTGVTIKEWTAVFMLSGSFSTSAANYLQTIFRVQSPCKKNGMFKKTAYVFDFAPDRTLKMVSEAVSVSNKAGKTNDSDKKALGKFLNYCPVISISGSQMKEYQVDRLLQELKKAYADKVVRSGFEDNNLYNDELLKLNDVDIEKFNELKGIIGKSNAAPKQNDITVNNQGLTNEEYEELERLNKKPKRELSDEEKARREELKKNQKVKTDAISILRGLSIRMPLLIYGADVPYDEEITLDGFIEKIDDSSWKEFMPNGVDKKLFKEFKKYYDEDIFIAAGRKIRNIAREADTLNPTERVKKIALLFSYFRNPDKETVLTPWRVVNMHMSDTLGGYDFWDEKHEKTIDEPRFVDRGKVTAETLGNPSAQILEINSKTGLYPLYVTYSIYRTKCKTYPESELTLDMQRKIWNDTIQQNVFVICKTPMAKQITQRTLAGYSDIIINAHYFEDLINQLQNKQQQFIDRILKASYWKRENMEKMNFNAVVGNPPYQENIGSSNENSSLSKQLFPVFIETAIKTDIQYVSLLTPSRWFTADAQDKSFIKLRDFVKDNNHFYKIVNYPNNKDLFKNVVIAGGVNYFLFIKEYAGEVSFIECTDNNCLKVIRPLFENGLDIIISTNKLISILNKVKRTSDFKSMTEITQGRNAFGITGKNNELVKITSEKKFTGAIPVRCAYEKIVYIKKENVQKNINIMNSWKIFTSKGNGGAGLLTDNKAVAILGKAYVGEPNSICTDSLIPIGCFETKIEAINLQKYMSTKFLRFMVGILKVSQNVYQSVYKFVPLQDFTEQSDIDWTKSISEIDQQLYKKYALTQEEIDFIENKIKPME